MAYPPLPPDYSELRLLLPIPVMSYTIFWLDKSLSNLFFKISTVSDMETIPQIYDSCSIKLFAKIIMASLLWTNNQAMSSRYRYAVVPSGG